ncbi:MAG: DNA polymerase III subunit epsilon [Gammaproteobacteria bacterium]|nr:DNA polymerase III subunit epsilon [Gammaproteobacteria bacterium]
MRQVVLDTETTGLEPEAGHRIIEIGGIELVNRRPTQNNFHRYINPARAVDPGALEVHGLDNDFLDDKPYFEDVAEDFLEFVAGAELVIHNADFDIAFLNHELARLDVSPSNIRERCGVLDTLALARRLHPGQRNNLDALAKRYEVDNSERDLHGALLDARILAEVYLAMTGGQASLSLGGQTDVTEPTELTITRVERAGIALTVRNADPEEESAHAAMLARIAEKSGAPALWEALGHDAGAENDTY